MAGPAGATAEPLAGTVTVRYWAGARAAAGVHDDQLSVDGPLTLEQVVAAVLARHADRPRLADVVAVCSVLVGERPVAAADPAEVTVHAGDVVDLLPPFAGG